jgi:hypothetical protein
MAHNRLAQFFATVVVGFAASSAKADMVTFVTPTGATTGGGPVNASATFTTSANTLTIGLHNLLANPTDVAQLLSDLSFTVGNGGSLTGASLASSSGQEITVNSGGTFTLGPTVATGWAPLLGGTSGLLNVLGAGGAGPMHLIIGPPGAGSLYSNANGSIAGNGPHNPFLNNSATFTISGTGITGDTTVTSATFSFGTTSGINVAGTLQTTPVPAPPALVLGLVGAAGLFGKRAWARRRTLEMA